MVGTVVGAVKEDAGPGLEELPGWRELGTVLPALEGTMLEGCEPCGVACWRLNAGGALEYGVSWYAGMCCGVYCIEDASEGILMSSDSPRPCVFARLGVPNGCAEVGCAVTGAERGAEVSKPYCPVCKGPAMLLSAWLSAYGGV